MNWPGIYYVGWKGDGKDREYDEFPFKVYVEVGDNVAFLGAYKELKEADAAVDTYYGDKHERQESQECRV